jgi:hypothetical protein
MGQHPFIPGSHSKTFFNFYGVLFLVSFHNVRTGEP